MIFHSLIYIVDSEGERIINCPIGTRIVQQPANQQKCTVEWVVTHAFLTFLYLSLSHSLSICVRCTTWQIGYRIDYTSPVVMMIDQDCKVMNDCWWNLNIGIVQCWNGELRNFVHHMWSSCWKFFLVWKDAFSNGKQKWIWIAKFVTTIIIDDGLMANYWQHCYIVLTSDHDIDNELSIVHLIIIYYSHYGVCFHSNVIIMLNGYG